MKAPRTVPEAESVFLLRNPNQQLKKNNPSYKLPRTDLDNESHKEENARLSVNNASK